MVDFLRTLLGIRKKRRALPITPRPQIGAVIVRDKVKAKLSQPCDPDLWDWLMLSGWRVNSMRNDRRTYVSLPKDAIARLNAADMGQRAMVHEELLNSVTRN